MMRILLAAKHAPYGPRPIGGVQSWCRTVARELIGRGYEVDTWGPGLPAPLGGFDLGIIANIGDTQRAYDWCTQSLTVCHGVIPAESPPGTGVVFTSEEVRDFWGGDGPVIRQPIDVDFWSPGDNRSTYLTRFSYRTGLPFVPLLATSLNCKYRHVRNQDAEGVRQVLRLSACVLATGRALLEAMATGAPVVLRDHRAAYQGPLMDLDIPGSMVRNYSGRGGVEPRFENVRDAVLEAMDRGSMREHVLEHHDVSNIVDQLLEAA